MFNKDVLMKFIAAQQQKTQPVVSNDGFLNGAPPAGTNYRIPSDTLYNPTPHRIKAVSDNGIETVLEPYDETNVTFPGAQYVDEYELHKAQEGEEVDYLKQEYNPSFNWRNFSNSLNYSRGTDAAPVYGSDLSYARGNADAGFNINREDQETTGYNSRLGYNGRHFNLSGNYGREGENRLRGFNAGANLGRFTGTLIGNQINRDQMTGSTGVEYNDEDHEISAGLSAERNAADHKFAGNFAVKGFSLETRMNKDKSGNAGAGLKTSFGGLTVGGSTSKNADGLHSYGATAKYQNDNGLSLSGQYNLTPLQEDLVRENVSGLANLGKYFISGDASFDNGDTGRWNASAGKRQGDLTFSAGYGNSRGGKESISAGARYGRGWNSVYGSAEYKNNGEDADTLGGKLGFGTKYINGEVEYLPGETPVYKGNLSLNLGPLNIGAKGIYEGDKFKLTPTAGVTYTFDGSEKKYGGLHKFLPKAQTGEETGIPADAARYGVNATPKEGAVYADPDLVNRLNYTQGTINQQGTFGNPREKFEQNVLNAVNNLEAQEFDVSEAGYLPEYLKEGAYYCISGVCYTLNQAGEPVRYYSNSLLQDDVIAGKVPGWKLNYDLGSIKGGDILQFTGNRGQPHHAALVIPNTIKTRENGDINFDVFMNGGDGQMYRENYTINPETDMSDVGQTTQLITRDFGDSMSDAVNIRDWLKNKIEEQDPQFFKKGKQKRRWETYSPGMFNEKGRTYVNMDGESLGYSTPTMMQNTNPDVQKAADLLRKRTLNGGVEYNADFDVDYNTLSKTAGFDQILNRVNDEQFKLDFMKRYNITNREYNAIVSNTFGIYGQESGFGTKKGGLTENDTARGIGRVVLDVASRLKGEGAKQPDIKEDFSRGLTQVKLRNLSKADRKKYGIDADALDNDPEKAFMAAMIVNAQNLPELRRLAAKGETAAVDESNYLDYLPYMYSMPGRLRRGDKKTIQAAIDNGKNPDEMVVQDPNSPLANNQYVQNVRAYANLFEHLPTTSTMEIKANGGAYFPNPDLMKFVGGGEHGGLDRWFAEKWVDVKTGKPCGRQEGEDRAYPACRPSRRVSEDTPKTSSEMSPAEKAKFKRTKTSSERIPYNHKRN